jgi:hypothetical protein
MQHDLEARPMIPTNSTFLKSFGVYEKLCLRKLGGARRAYTKRGWGEHEIKAERHMKSGNCKCMRVYSFGYVHI